MLKIDRVTIVSDGIVVEFDDNTNCYFPAASLHARRSELSGQLLLSHDPGLDDLSGDSITSLDLHAARRPRDPGMTQ